MLSCLAWLVHSLIASAGAVEALHLKGSIKFIDVKAGPVYLMVRSDGGTGLVAPPLESGDAAQKKEIAPTGKDFQGYLPAGAYGGQGDFEMDLPFPKGRYSVSAFVQNGESAIAKCETSDIGGLTVAHNCFPSKGDTVCPSFSVDVTSAKPILWNCGGAEVPGVRSAGKK